MNAGMTFAPLVRLVAAPLPAMSAAEATAKDAVAKVAKTVACAGVDI